MRKQKRGRKLSRKRDQRRALLKALASALILHEKIKTTEAKAKEIAGFAEKLITRSKRGDLPAKRFLGRFLSQQLVKKMIDELGVRYKERAGGYTRVIRLGQRKSDGAKMAIIELIK